MWTYTLASSLTEEREETFRFEVWTLAPTMWPVVHFVWLIALGRGRRGEERVREKRKGDLAMYTIDECLRIRKHNRLAHAKQCGMRWLKRGKTKNIEKQNKITKLNNGKGKVFMSTSCWCYHTHKCASVYFCWLHFSARRIWVAWFFFGRRHCVVTIRLLLI